MGICQETIEPFRTFTDIITRGCTLAEYRADHWRAVGRVAALFPGTACTSAAVPEFRPADTLNWNYSTIQALGDRSDLIEAISRPIDRTREVE